jgi:hypothetical protein
VQNKFASGREVEMIIGNIFEDNAFAITKEEDVDELLGKVVKETRGGDMREMKMRENSDQREMTLCGGIKTVEICEERRGGKVWGGMSDCCCRR